MRTFLWVLLVALAAFFIAITTAAGFVVVVALVIKYWRDYGG